MEGQCPRAARFGGAARLVKRKNTKWSFTNEPEVGLAALFNSPQGGTSPCRAPGSD